MANRYANLVGSNKIKDEYTKINAGFDAVQADVDAIQTELDQKADRAFAQVNDLPADTKADTITFEGGTGITITTNPNEKKVIVTATGTATPGPHGSEHLEFGSDPIPFATPTEGGLMSASDKSKLDNATSTSTPNTLVQRDPAGRFKAAAPSASDDVARKQEVDGKVSKSGDTMTGHLDFQHALGLRSLSTFAGPVLELGDFPNTTTGSPIARMFRNTNTSGDKNFVIHQGDGTGTVAFQIQNGRIIRLATRDITITAGTGSPEGVVAAPPGSIYLNASGGAGTTLYVKRSGTGNTGWFAVA